MERIDDFEQITDLPEESLKKALAFFSQEELVKASMGASPGVNALLAGIFPEIDFRKEQMETGGVKIEEVEELQRRMIERVNRNGGGRL